MKLLLLILCLGAQQSFGFDDKVTVFESNLTMAESSSRALPSRCGYNFHSRVIGGNVALPHKYPWASYLLIGLIQDGQRKIWACGATIISDQWLVSAAHCFPNAYQIVVRSGCLVNDNCESSDYASRLIIHWQYNSATYENDIALIQLRRPLRFSSRIQPACLPRTLLLDNTIFIVLGWGYTSNNGPGSAALKEGLTESQNESLCSRYFPSFDPRIMFCGIDRGASICSGDSGTAVGRFLNGRFQLDGVTSFGDTRSCDRFPNVFVRVTSFLSWIRYYV